jgi:sarcosine oxidase subunit gamma
MADTLFASSPLGHRAAAPCAVWRRGDGLVVSERPMVSALAIRFADTDSDALDAIRTRTGLRLENRLQAARSGGALGLCLGPGEWLVLHRAPASLAGAGTTLVEAGWSAVDASDAWFAVRLEGPGSRGVIAEASALDVRPDRFGPDATAVTRFARVRALVHRLEASEAFDVYVERSHAGYLWAWLSETMGHFPDTEGRT